jgi:hypothetical protein
LARIAGNKKCIQDFGYETGGRDDLGTARHRSEDNIKMDLQEMEWGNGLD